MSQLNVLNVKAKMLLATQVDCRFGITGAEIVKRVSRALRMLKSDK